MVRWWKRVFIKFPDSLFTSLQSHLDVRCLQCTDPGIMICGRVHQTLLGSPTEMGTPPRLRETLCVDPF